MQAVIKTTQSAAEQPPGTITREEAALLARTIEHLCAIATDNGWLLPTNAGLRTRYVTTRDS